MQVVSHQNVRLAAGQHAAPGPHGVCAMELASMLAGERFTDHPRAVSRTVAALMRGYNDALDDARRQTLLPLVAECVGTRRTRAVERERRRALRRELEALDDVPPAVRLAWRAGILRPYAAAHGIGQQIVARDDDARHAWTVALVRRLAAMGAEAPETAAAAAAPASSPAER